MEEVAALVNDSDPGDKVQLTIERDGETRTVEVTLGDRPNNCSANEGSFAWTPARTAGTTARIRPIALTG